MRGFLQGCRSRGLKRRPLLQTSSPLKPRKSTRGLTPRLVQQTGALHDEAIEKFAVAYADQTERDYAALLKAIRAGRIRARLKGED